MKKLYLIPMDVTPRGIPLRYVLCMEECDLRTARSRYQESYVLEGAKVFDVMKAISKLNIKFNADILVMPNDEVAYQFARMIKFNIQKKGE